MIITFTDTTSSVSKQYHPQLASSFVPDWYKSMESYISGKKEPIGDGTTTSTIKRCMPVFDAITAGYLLLTPADVWISQKIDQNGNMHPYYEWANFDLIEFHAVEQAPNHPAKNGHNFNYPKFINPWSIKTPNGYSVLFTQPMHRESPFTILDGIVDTDRYFAPVNFPFVLNDTTYTGLIPAGTPVAQVVPFKRDAWEMKIGSEQIIKEQNQVRVALRSKFFDGYKTLFRQNKEYK